MGNVKEKNRLKNLYKENYKELVLVAEQIVKNLPDAEEVVSIAMEYMLRRIQDKDLPPVVVLLPYVKKAIKCRSLNFLRDKKNRPQTNNQLNTLENMGKLIKKEDWYKF